jgi:hypothetical protein
LGERNQGSKDSGIQRVRLILELSIFSIIANVFGDDFFIRYSGRLVKPWKKSRQWGFLIGFFYPLARAISNNDNGVVLQKN